MGEVREFDLPWPPSVNRYYRHVGPRVLISREGRRYRMMVVSRLSGTRPLGGRLALTADCHPPDLRRRDLDNIQKGMLDSMAAAGLFGDDSQIRRIHLEMLEPEPGGRVHARLEEI